MDEQAKEPTAGELLNSFDYMAKNRTIWDAVQVTDPTQVKAIVGKDYKGSSPKPYWIIRRLTETFGPIGIGWGFRIISERFEKMSADETLHVAQVGLWYVWEGKRSEEIVQLGQTKAMYLTAEYQNKPAKIKVDEDAPKKSVTDALVKCASYIGFAGDIFMGLWDDAKYQDRARDYWTDGAPRQRRPKGQEPPTTPPASPPPRSSTPPRSAPPKSSGKEKVNVPKVVSDEMITAVSLALEVAKTAEEALVKAGEVFVWKKHNLITLPIAQAVGKTAITRVGALVKADTFDRFRQMIDAYVTQEILTSDEATIIYQNVRAGLNIVDPPANSNAPK